MSSTGADLLANIRAETLHDSDTQVTDLQIYAQLGLQHQRLRRWLIVHCPELGKVVSADISVSAGANSIAKSAITPGTGYTVEQVHLVERKEGDAWFPIDRRDDLNLNVELFAWLSRGGEAWDEFPDVFALRPALSAAATYRITYLAGVTKDMVAGTTIKLPEGLELVLQHRVSAWVLQRHSDDPSFSLSQAKEALKDFSVALRKRAGVHPRPALKYSGAWEL